MKVYYHKTDGGAEYLSTRPETERFWDGVFARVDGNELEIYTNQLKKMSINLKIN